MLQSSFEVTSRCLPSLSQLEPITSPGHDEDREGGLWLCALKSEYICRSHILLSHELVSELRDFVDAYHGAAELACGPGWLSYWLWRYGSGSLREAVDDASGSRSPSHPFVIRRDALAFVRSSPCIDLFLLVWPPPNALAWEIWQSMRSGQSLLYIGELEGCTADERFDRLVRREECIHPHIERMRSVYRSLPGAKDSLYLLHKTTSP
jgi:hypothetical protein